MNNSGYIFIVLFLSTFVLNGQTQYTSVPRSGEGRFDRSNSAIFWANPIFLKPAVFFSSSEMNTRSNRKWWRNEGQPLPKPYIAHEYLPEDTTLKARLDLAFVEPETSKSNRFDQDFLNPSIKLLRNGELESTVPNSLQIGQMDQFKHLRIGLLKTEGTELNCHLCPISILK